MKQVGKIIGSSLLSLLMLLGLILPMQNTVPIVQPMTVAANDITSHPAKGEVSGNGVYGYTTDYVCNGGPMQEEHAVQNGWHITAKNTYYAYGILWYQCWDTDDGDYYGWIDLNYVTIYSTNNSSSGSSPVTITSISPRKGQVAGNGVYGYASSYACYSDGAQATQHKVENTWHITAKNTCYSHGVTWYECWDTDDGDYYGWIDANYLSFYDTTPAPAQTQAPKQTVIVEKTVLVTEPPKETVIVEKTILVTESPTEPSTETKEQTTTKAAAAINLDDQSKNNASPLENVNLQLILIGAGILILAGVSIGLIILFVKKSKEKPAGSVQMSQLHNPWEESNSPMNPYAGQNSVSSNNQQMGGLVCPNCGAVCSDPDGKFCDQCGTPLK